MKIIGQLTSVQLANINHARGLITQRENEIKIFRHGLQHILNKVSEDHEFPSDFRLDYTTGVVYNVPIEEPPGEKDGRQDA